MAFPDRWWWGRPRGWEDRGAVHPIKRTGQDNATILTYEVHTFCGTTIHIGLESGTAFMFCPTCLVKVKDRPKSLKYRLQ